MAFERFFGATFADVPAFRVTHYKDPVPHLPLEAMGFHHTAREVYYAQWNNDYTVCDGSGEDGGCSNKHLVDVRACSAAWPSSALRRRRPRAPPRPPALYSSRLLLLSLVWLTLGRARRHACCIMDD